MKEYALYKGDNLLAVGTIPEICQVSMLQEKDCGAQTE